jgi:hypothetical protein
LIGDLDDALSSEPEIAPMLISLLEWRAGRRSVVSSSSTEITDAVLFDRHLGCLAR